MAKVLILAIMLSALAAFHHNGYVANADASPPARVSAYPVTDVRRGA